jgi:hypothetical protein
VIRFDLCAGVAADGGEHDHLQLAGDRRNVHAKHVHPPRRSVHSRSSVERGAAQGTLLQCCLSVARLHVACHLLHCMRHGPWRGSYADMIEWMHTHLKDRSKIVLSCAALCRSPLKAAR